MQPTRGMSGWRRITPSGARRPGSGSVRAWTGSTVWPPGDLVTAEQMRCLFGGGRHPLSVQLIAQTAESGVDAAAAELAMRLGLPFKVYAGDHPFRCEVAARFAAANRAAGRLATAALPVAERARIRTEVAREFFRRVHGRDPIAGRELSGILARLSRPATTAVAGYDLTFSP
jgi:hypothetical protein